MALEMAIHRPPGLVLASLSYMRTDGRVARSGDLAAPWRLAKSCMVLYVLVVSAPCSHTHEPGAIDTPISFWNSWYDTCRIHRACKPIEPMPHCPPGLLVSAARRAFTASKDGKDVHRVVGTLQSGPGFCTKAWCEIEGKPQWQVCCNGCESRVVLVGEDGSVVGLTGEECVGDESRLCCTIGVQGQKIIATGVLVDEYQRGKLWFKGPYDVCALQAR